MFACARSRAIAFQAWLFPHPPYVVEDPWFSAIDRAAIPPRHAAGDPAQKPSLLAGIRARQRLTGWSIVRVSWMGSLVFGAGLIGMLVLGWNSDRTRERRWHFAIPQLIAALALGAWLLAPHSNVLLVLAFALIGFGTTAYLPSFWALPSAFLTSLAAAAAIGFINCVASIGGFFGTKIVGELSQRTGSFNGGFILMIACWTISSVLVLLCPREREAL